MPLVCTEHRCVLHEGELCVIGEEFLAFGIIYDL